MADNTYSRLVGALKVILPLAALMLLSTLFLLSRGTDPGTGLPYAEVDIEALMRTPRMTAPTYTGVTRDGSAITLTARSARSEPGGDQAMGRAGGLAEMPHLLLVAPDGVETIARADEARMDPDAKVLVLSGGVEISTGGYRIESGMILAALDRTRLESPGPVTATGPQGTIAAGSMVIDRADPAAPEVLVFKAGVKLLYDPKV